MYMKFFTNLMHVEAFVGYLARKSSYNPENGFLISADIRNAIRYPQIPEYGYTYFVERGFLSNSNI
jgi:hypothetical protein